jgi:large repetitive protein
MTSLRLAPVTLTVNPSPNLMLHYFMERNILGDDALTSPGEWSPRYRRSWR